MQTHNFNLFADYFQFYVQDESVDGNLSDSWTGEVVVRMLAVASGTIGIGTVRNMEVPVIVEVRESKPKDEFASWDHVAECSIDVPSGRLDVAGCTDYFPDAARIELSPGCYRARVSYGGLDTLSEDGLEGNDRYEVVLWPAPSGEVRVLKNWHGVKARYQTL
jgi:hypothetical protein